MTDLDELRERVNQVSAWPPISPDGAEMMRRAANRRTRRNRIAVAGGVAMVIGAIAVAPVTLEGVFNNEDGGVPPATAPSGQQSLDVARGYRPVGALGLVFEVPTKWGTVEVACDGSPAADTVAFGFGRDCLVPDPPKVSSLLITTDDNFLVSDVLSHIELSAAPGLGSTELRVSDPAQLDGLWTFAVADPAGNVAVLRAKDEAVARHTRDALREIPSGYVTIPRMPGLSSNEVEAKLSSLGIAPVPKNVPADGASPGDVLGTNPPVASVVRVGQQVEVLIAGGH